MFPMMASYAAVLAVAFLYYAWRDTCRTKVRDRAVLNERVAYMLWVAAHRSG